MIFTYRCWPFVWMLLGLVSSHRLQADELLVYPPQVVVRPDYPAQLVITRVDGERSIDVTGLAEIIIDQAESPALAIDNQRSRLSRTDLPLANDFQTTARVCFESLESTVAVQVIGGSTPPPIFPREVAAVLGKSGCNLGTCHGNLHGKGGFRLSLRGDDPLLDFAAIVRGQAGRRIDRFDPDASLLLRKPLGLTAHQGGQRFATDSPEAQILRRWIAEGVRWNAAAEVVVPNGSAQAAPEETVASLQVYPSRGLLAKAGRQQQLCVIATFADGSVRDVTPLARYEPSSPTGVTVSPDGLVNVQQAIDVSISISYLAGRTASRLTFLPHDDTPWPKTAALSQVDRLVDQQLHRLQVQPQPLADDFVFVRRAHLAIAGRLPSADEVREFCLNEHAPDKHQRLVERLLHEPGYAWLWALRWSDLLRNEQKVMSDRGAAQWHAWMAKQIGNDRPLSEFVAEMIKTVGSTYDHPPASFHRTHRDPETAAESIGQVFLGVRLQCARCHNHPFDKWRQDDYYGLAAYFTTLERKQVDNAPKDKFDKHIISGDEIITLTSTAAKIRHPGRAAEVAPKPLTENYTAAPTANPEGSPLESLAQWLTVNNRMFARNMANRIWYHIMGVGIVDPPDDFRDSNPPSNPELLEYLTDQLIASGYSTRHVTRLIVTSQAFRRSSVAEPDALSPLGGARVFSGYPLRRMPAETLLDAICAVTDVYPEKAQNRSEALAVAKVNVPTKADFLTTFGKPGRLLVCECERSSEVSLGQSLVLVNGTETRERLAAKQNLLARLAQSDSTTNDKLHILYLTALARLPTAVELDALGSYVNSAESQRSALEDVLWALINSKEFSLVR